MRLKERLFFLLVLAFYCNLASAQGFKYALSSQSAASRFCFYHNFGGEIESNKFRFGAFLGYNPIQLFRYRHLSSNFKFSANFKFVEEKRIFVYATGDFLAAQNLVSSNNSLNLFSFFAGYGFIYGKRFQFVQSLSLGGTRLTANGLNPYWMGDCQVMVGVRYLIQNQNEH